MKRVASYWFLFSVLVTGTACRDSLSTSPTNVAPSTVTMSESATSPTATSPTAVDLEGFTCEDLEEVRVRFSNPGFIRGNEVALYAAFLGAPPGDKFLRIYWDYANKPDKFQIVDVQEGEVRRNNDELFDIEEIVEHTYEGLSGPTERTVRVELVHEDGNTRLCARNRHITVRPPAAPTGFDPPAVGTTGDAGVKSGDDWIVCRAGQSTAWVSANNGGQYNAVTACGSLGYTGVNDWGGTFGNVCVSEVYDGNGGSSPTNLATTVHWRCTR